MSKINSEDYEKIEKINLEQQKAIQENAKAVAIKEIQEENDRNSYNALLTYIENYKDKNVVLDSRRLTNFIKLHKILSNRYQAELEYYKGLAQDNKNSMDDYEEEIKDIEKEHVKEVKKKNQAYNKLAHRVLNLREKCKDRNFKIKVLCFLIILSNLITFDITYHYQHDTVSYTQYKIQTIFEWSYALLYLCYLIVNDMISGIYRAFMSN